MKKTWFPLVIAISFFSFTSRTSCNSTAVKLAQIPSTGGAITKEGTYYLAHDIKGSLAINADHVTLNLNGHTVYHITITSHSDISITNGLVDSTNAAPGVNAGVSIDDCSNVRLSDLKVSYAGPTSRLIEGIHITGGRNLFLSHILIDDFSSAGCKIDGAPLFVLISDCEFSKNGSAPDPVTPDDRAGLLIEHTDNAPTTINIIVKRCLATGNRKDGFRVTGRSTDNPTVWFFDCTANNNGIEPGLESSESIGFNGVQITSTAPEFGTFVAMRCIAENNSWIGFYAQSKTQFYFEQCIACNNGTPSIEGDGIRAKGDSIGQVKECTAFGNSRCGFNNSGSGGNNQPVAYVANSAYNNQKHNYCLNSNNRRDQFPYCVRSPTVPEALYWRNTDELRF